MGWKWWQRDRVRTTPTSKHDLPTVATMGPDPLDPHGDGTLRAGDPLFDLMMGGSGPVMFNRVGDTDD